MTVGCAAGGYVGGKRSPRRLKDAKLLLVASSAFGYRVQHTNNELWSKGRRVPLNSTIHNNGTLHTVTMTETRSLKWVSDARSASLWWFRWLIMAGDSDDHDLAPLVRSTSTQLKAPFPRTTRQSRPPSAGAVSSPLMASRYVLAALARYLRFLAPA